MKLSAEQLNMTRYKMPVKNVTKFGTNVLPSNNISFGANLNAIFNKTKDSITIKNASVVIDKIDDIFGDKFFTKQIEKSGVNFKDDILKVRNRSFFKDDLKDTFTFFTSELIPRCAKGIASIFKIPLKEDGWVQTALKKHEQKEAYYYVQSIVEKFANKKNNKEFVLDTEKISEHFKRQATGGVTKVNKNYATRDERTLNRAATSLVSAAFSGMDFYNISMLEKDDKKEANKTGKARFGQEVIRMTISALTVFLSLGLFDRFTKKNIFANSLVIAGSALISETVSRLISKTPLKRLTPEEAAQIAKERKEEAKNHKTLKDSTQTTQATQPKPNSNIQTANIQANNVQFKSNIKSTDEIYKNFKSKNGSFTALDEQTRQIAIAGNETEPQGKKKMSIGKILGLATLASTILYVFTQIKKGTFSSLIHKNTFNKRFKNVDLLNPENLKVAQTEYEKVCQIGDKEPFEFFTKIVDKITKKEIEINAQQVKTKLEHLVKTPEGKEIETLINEYIKKIDFFTKNNNTTFIAKKDKFFISGLYSGVTKIFKTLYTFLSLPAKGLCALTEKLMGKKHISATFNRITAEMQKPNIASYKKEIESLSELLFADKLHKAKTDTEIINIIKRRARTIEESIPTGELANISRTFVTLIGTFFFVNDYRNNVLIESEGKNIEGAKTEEKERIAHKLANFVINGTLMNVFNSVFSTVVNNSLIGATLVAAATETTNETLVRKSICQPIGKQKSKKDIIDFEEQQMNKKGIAGWWTRTFKKLTGKKSLTEKAAAKTKKQK